MSSPKGQRVNKAANLKSMRDSFCISITCWVQPEDFVHITDNYLARQRKKPSGVPDPALTTLSTPCPFSSWSSSSTPICTYSSALLLRLFPSIVHINIKCTCATCKMAYILYSLFDHFIRNKCEQFWAVVCKWWQLCCSCVTFPTSASQCKMCCEQECVLQKQCMKFANGF